MPAKKKAPYNKYKSDDEASIAKTLAASFSVWAFFITLAIGAAAFTGIGFALYKTAPQPEYDAWPYVEITIAPAMEQHIADTHDQTVAATNQQQDENTDSTEQHTTEHTAEYGVEDDTHYKVDLTHDERLYGEIDGGVIVPKRHGKLSVFNNYRTALFDDLKTRPYKGVVSLVMVDYGLSDKITQQVEKAFDKTHITYALSPYAHHHQDIVDSARKKGHEVWLTLPLQSANFPWVETGPMTLLIRSKANENRRRLIWLLSLAKGFPGIINIEETNFTYSESDANTLFSALYEHGTAYVSGNTEKKTLASSLAKANKVPFTTNDMWLNKTGRIDDLESNLAKLANTALDTKNGKATIAFFEPQPKTIETIAKWAQKVQKEKGIIFVPLSFSLSEF